MSGVRFYQSRIRAITDSIPERAHATAAAKAAGIAAKEIKSKGTGTLARDVSRPKRVTVMHRQIGSNLPYAAIENWGGTIRPRGAQRLLIRGSRGRSTSGAPIVASAEEVQHKGKHYLEAGANAFPNLFISELRRLMP